MDSSAVILKAARNCHEGNLRRIFWCRSRTIAKTRLNKIRGEYIEGVHGGMLGISKAYHTNEHNLSQLIRTKSGCELARVLCREIRKRYPKFKFSSIQVNRNWPGALHVDRSNVGPSIMYTIGPEKIHGGDLFVYDSDLDSCRRIKTFDKWIQFNGSHPHFTSQYKGVRYSFVFFQCLTDIPNHLRTKLLDIGFNLPTHTLKKTKRRMSITERMRRAVTKMKEHYPDLFAYYEQLHDPDGQLLYGRTRHGGPFYVKRRST